MGQGYCMKFDKQNLPWKRMSFFFKLSFLCVQWWYYIIYFWMIALKMSLGIRCSICCIVCFFRAHCDRWRTDSSNFIFNLANKSCHFINQLKYEYTHDFNDMNYLRVESFLRFYLKKTRFFRQKKQKNSGNYEQLFENSRLPIRTVIRSTSLTLYLSDFFRYKNFIALNF